MKVLRYLLLVIPVLLMASNCPNKKNKEPNVIRGRLMYGCDTPAPNVKLTLVGGVKNVETVDGLTEIYTDEDGYFEFKFLPVMSWYTLKSPPQKIMTQIPNQDYLDLGEVNWNVPVNFLIKLQVNNPYTENDTLYYSNWSYPNPSDLTLKLAGPFESGIIDTAISVPYMKTLIYNHQPELNMTYYINAPEDNTIYFPVFPCSNTLGEVAFIIE